MGAAAVVATTTTEHAKAIVRILALATAKGTTGV